MEMSHNSVTRLSCWHGVLLTNCPHEAECVIIDIVHGTGLETVRNQSIGTHDFTDQKRIDISTEYCVKRTSGIT